MTVLTQNFSESMARGWDIHLDSARGVYYQLNGEKKQSFMLHKRVLDRALNDEYWDVGKEAAVVTGFQLWQMHTSIPEIAQSHYDLFRCMEGRGLTKETQENVSNLGIELFRLWSKLECRKLPTGNLRPIKYLCDPAHKLLDKGYSESQAAPIMVLLLLKCFDHFSNYKEVLDVLEITKEPPEEIKTLLEN